jgi:hypothetical protein
VVVMQPYIDPTNSDERLFCVGTYLLLKGTRTFLNMVGGGSGSDTGFYYWPEYTVQLGTATTPLPTDFSTYMVGNVYQRSFQNGVVMVNGSGSAVTATVPGSQTMYRASFSAGGSVNDANIDANGNLLSGFMSVSSTAVSGTISINAWSAAILLNSAP